MRVHPQTPSNDIYATFRVNSKHGQKFCCTIFEQTENFFRKLRLYLYLIDDNYFVIKNNITFTIDDNYFVIKSNITFTIRFERILTKCKYRFFLNWPAHHNGQKFGALAQP